jgi:cell division protein FtsB
MERMDTQEKLDRLEINYDYLKEENEELKEENKKLKEQIDKLLNHNNKDGKQIRTAIE